MGQSPAKASLQHVDLGARRVAHVYADALLRAARAKGVEDEILAQYDSLVNDLLADQRVEALLSQAAVGRKRRAEIIDKFFATRADPVFTQYLHVLSEHDRLDLIRAGLIELRQLYDEFKGRTRVHVTSAVDLEPAQKDRLVSDIRDSFRIEPVLDVKVDPSILGGLKVLIGDWQYDATVRTRIDNIRNQILARSSHEIQSGRDRFSSAV